jgi:hypothetical protein
MGTRFKPREAGYAEIPRFLDADVTAITERFVTGLAAVDKCMVLAFSNWRMEGVTPAAREASRTCVHSHK